MVFLQVRTGILALQLLPRNSTAGLIVVSDGTMAIPDIETSDALLSQLRTKTISLSFLLVSSPYFPQSAYSRLPYQDLMIFMSRSTYGVYMPQVGILLLLLSLLLLMLLILMLVGLLIVLLLLILPLLILLLPPVLLLLVLLLSLLLLLALLLLTGATAVNLAAADCCC